MADARDDDLAALLKEVRRIEVQSRRLATDVMAGGYASVFKGGGLEVAEVREYADGDDPRSIDWNVTARVGRPYVKRYVEERERTVVFALDLSRSMDGGFGPWSARATAARVVACLAFSAVRAGDAVGLCAFGQRVERWVEPGRGAAHALRIVRDALALPATAGSTVPGEALGFLGRALRRRAVVFLVSDFLEAAREPGAPEARAELARCARRHDLIAVRLLLPEADVEAGAQAGVRLVRVHDPESGRTRLLDAGHLRTRAVVAERVAAWRLRMEDTLARAGVDRMDVPVPRVVTRDAVAGPILRFFRMREERGAKR